MKFNSLIPELSVSNIERSKDFYLSLGFKIRYERKENKFCFIELEENQIISFTLKVVKKLKIS